MLARLPPPRPAPLRPQDAAQAGTARKAAKREPTSSPGGMETSAQSGSGGGGGDCQLSALTSRRG